MIKNLTPHALTLVSETGTETFPSEGLARCAQATQSAGDHEGIPLVNTVFGAVDGLPDPEPGVLYVVSALVRAAVPSRTDVASPGDLVRDSAGAVIGCRCLVVNPIA
jgi:hypothetical protein